MSLLTKHLLAAAVLAGCLGIGCGQVCPFGWVERPGSDTCYLLSADSVKYKFPEAVGKCQSYQGQLLTIRNASEKTWVLNQLQSISAAYANARSWWLGLQYVNNNYQWVDGTEVQTNQLPWQGGSPSHANGECYTLEKQQVVNTACTTWNNILCTRPKSLPLSCDVDSQWIYINGSCFKIFNDSRSWDDAKSLCEMQESHLATISTFMEHSELWDRARNANTTLWTGLTVSAEEDEFDLSWVDGSMLDTSQVFWREDQPGELRAATSMAIDGTVPRRLKSWFMDNTTAFHHYACQKPQGVCEDGWLTHQTTCFKMYDMTVAWSYASFVCSAIGGQLVNLALPSDQEFIQRYFPEFKAAGQDSFWIGISDAGNDKGPFKWSDGSEVVNLVSHWAQDPPPNNTVGSRDCGFIDTNDVEGRWQMTSDCLQQRSFVCTIPVNVPVKPIPTTPAPGGQCDSGWVQAPNKCYFFSDKGLDWQGASQACVQQGGTLAVILSEDDQTFINGHLAKNTDYWFGLSDIQTEGTWVWADGTPLSQPLYWSSGEPNGNGGDEDCAMLWGTRGEEMLGEWNDEHCNKQQPYICQKTPAYRAITAAPRTTTPKAIVYSEKCGPNWEERPNSDLCYQFHEELKRHEDALAACQSYNGSLVSITDHVEQSYLAGRIHSMQVSGVWLGATDSSVEGGWTWTDESPFSFINWAPDEPNNLNDAQDCAAMTTKDSLWHDFNCRLKLGFICKKFANTHTTTARPNTTPLPPGKHWSCPRGYLGYHFNCYATHSTAMTWSDAQKACRTEGAELVSVANMQENDYIFSRLPTDNSNLTGWWLGLNEFQVKGSFMWSDMTRVTFTNWHTGMPLAYPTPSCAVMTKVDGGTWANGPCEGFARYICKKPVSIADVTSIQPYKVGCPIRSYGMNEYCYQIVTTMQANWKDAEAFCNRNMHGHLATINSVMIQSFVVPELDLSVSSHYWIGLSDTATKGTYVWSSGLPVLYSAWNANHTGNEQGTCVAMQTRRPIGLWQSMDCSQSKPFVCQYPRSGYTTPTVTTPVVTTTPPPCLAGWSGFEANCYKAIKDSDSRKSWTDARDFCRSYGGDLASIHNDTVNSFIKSHFASYGVVNFWIGLTDADTEGTYEWSDGTPVQFTKWYRGEPNNAGGNEDCAEYNSFTNSWNDNSCYLINNFICSIPRGKPLLTTQNPPTTTPAPKCDGTDWLSKDGYCYYFSPQFGSDATKTWFEARRFCQQNGADLASILSEEDNSFLVQFLTKRSRFNVQYWIGFNQLGGVSYGWTDKSPVVFTSWSQSEPNDAYGGQSCTNIYSLSGKWNDDNCNDKFHFICKRSNSSRSAIPPVPTPLIQGGCPPGFSGTGNKCYKAVGLTGSKGLNYTQARDTCRAITTKHPVDIASITNEQQQAFVMTLLEGINGSVYIGLNDRHLNNHFEWQNNEEVTVTYWAPGQPSEKWIHYGTAEEDCVVMRVTEKDFGLWDDVYCGSQNGYVCQTSKDSSYPITSPDTGGCKTGYFHYRDSCYGSYKMPKSWSDAESMCKMDGGHLVSLRDIHELAKVDLFVSNDVIIGPVWIGLSFQQNTGQYSWLDGWPVTLTRWDEGEPDMQSAGSCVKMSNGVWNDTACNETNPFVCKISSVTPPPTTPPPPGYCADPKWAPNGDFCYYAAVYDRKSWPEANYMCRKLGMEILSLHSADEMGFVQSLVTLATTPRYSVLNEKRVWLGLQRTSEGGFRWSDGSPTDYFNWNQGEPNYMNEQEECAELLVDAGKWNDISCIGGTRGDRGYICKTRKILPSTSTTTTTTTTSTTTTTPSTPSTSPSTTASPATPQHRTAYPTFGPRRSTGTPRGTYSPLNPQVFTKNPRNTGNVGKSTGGNSSNTNTLSGGEIAGIVIGLLALIAIVVAVVFVFRRRRGAHFTGAIESAAGFDNALYSKSQDQEEVTLSSNGTHSSLNGTNRLNIVNHADDATC